MRVWWQVRVNLAMRVVLTRKISGRCRGMYLGTEGVLRWGAFGP